MGGRVHSLPIAVAVALLVPTIPTSVHAADDRPFDPVLEVTPLAAVDTVSNFEVRVTQNDLTVPASSYVASIPGWRFAPEQIRRSNLSSCADIPSAGLRNPDDQSGWDMEAIGLASLTIVTDDIRQPPDENFDPIDESSGLDTKDARNEAGLSPASAPPAVYKGSTSNQAALWFLEWDDASSTATLCGRVVTNSSSIPVNDPEPGGPQDLRTIIFQVLLQRQPDTSWRMTFDLSRVPGTDPSRPRSLTDNDYFLRQNTSLLAAHLEISGRSGGNFSLDPEGNPCTDPNTGAVVGGGQMNGCSTVFSRTPNAAGDYHASVVLSPCALSNPGCTRSSRTLESVIRITPPATNFIHRAGFLTGPINPGVPTGFGVIRGTHDVTLSWQQPSMHPSEPVRGYVLVVAPPGDQDGRHFEYIVTDPDQPGFDARRPCGPDGRESICDLTLSFPLSTMGPTPLRPDGIYDAALVTMYPDGHRTDGLCDMGPTKPQGEACEPSQPPANIQDQPPGISTWQFMIRSKEWPLAYVESQTFRRSPAGTGGSFRVPAYVLLVDFALRRAEFVVWHSQFDTCVGAGGGSVGQGDVQVPVPGVEGGCIDAIRGIPAGGSYFAASNAIIGDNAVGGAVSFSSATMTGHTTNFRFEGSALAAPTLCAVTTQGTPLLAEACGRFTLYDLKGLPGAIPPGGTPKFFVEPFEGVLIP